MELRQMAAQKQEKKCPDPISRITGQPSKTFI